jgi:hypothetical protein
MHYDINEGYYCPIAAESKKYKTLARHMEVAVQNSRKYFSF